MTWIPSWPAASARAAASSGPPSATVTVAPQLVQDGPVAARSDHPASAHPRGQRHGDAPRHTGGAQHQHGFPGLQRGPPGQRQPGTHCRVDDRRGGHLVQAVRQRQHEPSRRALGHGPVRGADTTEIHPGTVRGAARAIDTGDHRQRALAAIVLPAGQHPHDRVQTSGGDLDQGLPTGDGRLGEIGEPRGRRQRIDHRRLHRRRLPQVAPSRVVPARRVPPDRPKPCQSTASDTGSRRLARGHVRPAPTYPELEPASQTATRIHLRLLSATLG